LRSIAYRQPITRADVEAVAGVTIDGVLQTLMERGLVKISRARRNSGAVPCFTKRRNFFSIIFGLRNLDELPNVEELRTRHLPVSPRPPATVAGDAVAGPASPTTRHRNDGRALSRLSIVASLTTSTSVLCRHSTRQLRTRANYSENKRGFSMLVIQNGRNRFRTLRQWRFGGLAL